MRALYFRTRGNRCSLRGAERVCSWRDCGILLGNLIVRFRGTAKSALMTGLGALPPFMLNEGLVTMGSNRPFAANPTNDRSWPLADINDSAPRIRDPASSKQSRLWPYVPAKTSRICVFNCEPASVSSELSYRPNSMLGSLGRSVDFGRAFTPDDIKSGVLAVTPSPA